MKLYSFRNISAFELKRHLKGSCLINSPKCRNLALLHFVNLRFKFLYISAQFCLPKCQKASPEVSRSIVHFHFQALNDEFGPFKGHFLVSFATVTCFKLPLFQFLICQVVPIEKSCNCTDLLYPTTECTENLLRVLYFTSKQGWPILVFFLSVGPP